MSGEKLVVDSDRMVNYCIIAIHVQAPILRARTLTALRFREFIPVQQLTEQELRLLAEARQGDEQALARLFQSYRPRLYRMILLRMDLRVSARCDASDVLQESYVELARRLPEYSPEKDPPFFLWLRMIAGERLAKIHRRHLGAAKRDVNREVPLQRQAAPEASSIFMAMQLVGQYSSVDRNLMREEIHQRLRVALDGMEENDREVLALRHFEELSTEETALVLGLSRSGVLKRYTKALRRLRQAMSADSTPWPAI